MRFCPRTLSPDECGETYRYFAHQKGVRATYVKDKHINDTLNVDALLLEATSQQGWELLVKVFDIPPLTQEERATMQRQKDYTWSRIIPKEDKNHSIRESLPSLWYSVTAAERES